MIVRRVALAAVTAVFYAVALPPLDQAWLGWIVLVPLLLAVRDLSAEHARAACGSWKMA